MRIIRYEPAPADHRRHVGCFDVEINSHIKMYNLRLCRNQAGEYRVYGPNAFGTSTAAFSQTIVQGFVTLLQPHLNGAMSHDPAAA